jgi:DNA polymerase V
LLIFLANLNSNFRNMIRQIEIPRNGDLDSLEDPGRTSGFVSPAEDYVQRRLHIANMIVEDPVNTFYFKVDDDQMRFFNIVKGGIAVVDRSLPVKNGSIVVCHLDNEWLIRKLCKRNGKNYLCINDSFESCIDLTGRKLEIFGTVSWVCLPSK